MSLDCIVRQRGVADKVHDLAVAAADTGTVPDKCCRGKGKAPPAATMQIVSFLIPSNIASPFSIQIMSLKHVG